MTYFNTTKPLPNEIRLPTFEELAKTYQIAMTHGQRKGILHEIAERGLVRAQGETSSGIAHAPSAATRFLLQIANNVAPIELDGSRRDLALTLFLQRILPAVGLEDYASREQILQFLAVDREAYQRIPHASEKHVRNFLLQVWCHGRSDSWTPCRDHLLEATIGAGHSDLLLEADRGLPFDVIPRLYMRLMQSKNDGEQPPVPLTFRAWGEQGLEADLDAIMRELRSQRNRDRFTTDSHELLRACGLFLGRDRDCSRFTSQLASTLLSLLSSLHFKLFGAESER